jgi:hypothetical protein
VADKLTPLIVDALTRAAAEPGGVALFGTRSDPALFPATAAAKPAAKKALDDGLLEVVRTEAKGKQSREFAAATEAGLRYLLDQVSPKQVLEDFVRVLEKREGQVAELLEAANRMADSLDGLKAAVAVVLPRVQAGRIKAEANVPAFFPDREGPSKPFDEPLFVPAGRRGGVAVLEAPVAVDALAEAVLARLSDWSASAAVGQDCPLPELYRSLSTREVPPTIGQFHDCLRRLQESHRVYLHPWTGPLYALPEPAFALLAGHNVAYYASAR